MTVAHLQHGSPIDNEIDRAITARAVIEKMERYLGKSIAASIEDRAFFQDDDDEIDLANLRRAASNFSVTDAERLLRLIPEERVKEEYRRLFHRAELLRKAARLHGARAKLFDDLTPRDLIHEIGRGQSKRTGSEADYWTIMLLWMQLSYGDDPTVLNYLNLRGHYDRYVARIRIAQGEIPAFRNALILRNAYLVTHPFDSFEQRHALLGISYIAIDLAAQINDYRALWALADSLADIEHEGFTAGAERALLSRLIHDARSRANRYCPDFDYDSRVRKEAGVLALAAVEPAVQVLRAVGGPGVFLARAHHGLGWKLFWPSELRNHCRLAA
jgi:hypothetical protein